MQTIPRFRLYVSKEEINAISETANKGNFVIGKEIDLFENKLARLFNKQYSFATVNGFSALLLSILATGIKGKNVLLPALSTCFSITNAVKASGNKPIYCDTELTTGNIDKESARRIFDSEGFDLIISPNYFGIPSNIKALNEFGIPIIEDCAQSFFTNLSNTNNSDFLVFSFYPTKMINAIDGGAILTNKNLFGKFVKDIGTYRTQLNNDGQMRLNLRIPNLHAAVGLASLNRLKKIKKKYNCLIKKYSEIIDSFEQCFYLGEKNKNDITLYKFILVFQKEKNLKKFKNLMAKSGIECSKELLALKDLSKFKNSISLLNTHCSIPLYEGLSYSEGNYISECLFKSLKVI